MISSIFNIIFYQPLYNSLVFLTSVLPFHDLGLAIIFLTVIVRFILLPLSHKSVVTQRKIKEIEPEISKIKNKLKDNREEQARQTMALYKEHGISPFSSFFALLVQFPVFIALFLLLKSDSLFDPNNLYSFINFPQEVNMFFLGIVDLSRANYFFAAFAGISQFFQIRLAMPQTKRNTTKDHSFKAELQRSMSVQMKYIMPIFIFFIAMRFSSGLALYWTVSNVFAIVHEIAVSKKAKKLKENAGSNPINKKNNR